MLCTVFLQGRRLLALACAVWALNGLAAAPAPVAYTVQGEGDQRWARVLSRDGQCPLIRLDQGPAQRMALRAAPARRASRHADRPQPTVFDAAVCETLLPPGTRQASVGSVALPMAAPAIRRIVLLGDTGCRMKAPAEFQPCHDAAQWPFAAVARQAAALHPDLVVHLGDVHYRESPCPDGMAGCAGSPWGYGEDAWRADFFTPAGPLLAAAPWVFVRGNHESCARAGQGWFRFLDAQPWTPSRSCDDPAQDGQADHSAPYAVPVAADTQLIVFDSSRAGAHAYAPGEAAHTTYLAQMARVAELAAQQPHNLFLNHHPVLGFHTVAGGQAVKPGNAALQSVLAVLQPQRYFPPGVDLALHGHVHAFESVSFAGDVPAALVLGHGGSSHYPLPATLPAGATPAPGLVVTDYLSWPEFGFATLDRLGDGWQLTGWNTRGQAVLDCALQGTRSHCQRRADGPAAALAQ